ncbi:SMI1/KNR4 family protein [Pelagicoccus sp. SDUM812005]|uniref:SMI1/KNR4 family protein n=1 Tax=Pelagicoccus sp. SDUM812005 TaxID=3041257 RepID=UPI00280F3616|nr:SMI1/KNR4 family protein [Pelagicoccus sp. SDUM812005]MDQ8183870.1 SMI1/KNR4 family protein [Pelagicoccus sp. SDUM812005]
MSDLAAASLVIGILVLVGGPALYWIFFKDGTDYTEHNAATDEPTPLKQKEVDEIERSLAVTLPRSYSAFLQSENRRGIDDTTILSNAELIISFTEDYRKGFESVDPWPSNLVYIGDEGDATPFILDTNDGFIRRHPKGYITKKPFESYDSFDSFLNEMEEKNKSYQVGAHNVRKRTP